MKIRLVAPSLVTSITINWAGTSRAKKSGTQPIAARTIDMAVRMVAMTTMVMVPRASCTNVLTILPH